MSRMIAVGSWLLGKLARGPYVDAVAGDLAEGVRAGRGAWWYWWQVVGAMMAAWRRGLETRAGRVVFVLGWAAIYRTWHWQHFVMEPIFRPVLWWINHDVAIPYRHAVAVSSFLLVDSLIFVAVFVIYRALRGRGGPEVPVRRVVWGSLAGLVFFAAAQVGLWQTAEALSLGYRDPARHALRVLLFNNVLWRGHPMIVWLWEPTLVAVSTYCVIAWALPLRHDEMDGRGATA